MDHITQLIVAFTGLLVAVNTILSLVLKAKVHTVKDLVNGRMDDAIQAHRAEAYAIGLKDGSDRRAERRRVSESQEPPPAPPP